MSPIKEAVIKMVEALPDNCTWEDVQYRLYVRAKVEQGLLDIEEGNVVSQQEAERRIEEWLQSLGAQEP
jgi:predicted transcriptional regulator